MTFAFLLQDVGEDILLQPVRGCQELFFDFLQQGETYCKQTLKRFLSSRDKFGVDGKERTQKPEM
jgi:hypothetical protein